MRVTATPDGQHPESKPGQPNDRWMVLLSAYPRESLAVQGRADARDVNTVSVDRVVVLGRGGAGKSVLARDLGTVATLPVIELDKEFWSARLEPMALDVWRERQRTLADEARWIMDGDLGPYDDLEPRLRRADTVVVLDMPLWLCAWRALRRGRERRDCWRWVLRWKRESRPNLMAAIASHAPDANVVVLRGRRAVKRWLAVA